LGIGPLRQKICQHLGFDCFARRIREGLTHELDRLLGYPSRGLPVLDYLP
jgi:hypothetical protein